MMATSNYRQMEKENPFPAGKDEKMSWHNRNRGVRVVLRAGLALMLSLVWAVPSAAAAPKPLAKTSAFPCTANGPCFVWVHGTFTFKEDAHWTLGSTTNDKHENMFVAVGLVRRADGLPSALYKDSLSTSTVVKIPGCSITNIVNGSGSGRGHLEFGYGDGLAPLVRWYMDKEYHIVFVPDIGFHATEKSTGASCKLTPEDDYPKPTMVIMDFLTPKLANPLVLTGKMITFGKLKQGTEGEGACQLPDGAKGTDVCTTVWNLKAEFSTKAQSGP